MRAQIYVRERLLKHGTTDKELAAELGYSHANDLSHAYKKSFRRGHPGGPAAGGPAKLASVVGVR